jgi:osmotically-inducible protein OsmY
MNERADEAPHYLVQRIREALAHDPAVAELELEVTVRGSKVFVAGTIPTKDRQSAITDVVQRAAPDHEVHNETSVAVMSGTVDEEELP